MDPIQKLQSSEATRRALTLFDEFKTFAFKGRVIDLAVGVIVGTAFGNIINSLVKNIIMPVLGLVLPGPEGYLGWQWKIGATIVPYGVFIGDVVNFLIIALAMFFFTVKFLGWVLHQHEEDATATPPPTKQEELLTEIRDLLKKATPAEPEAPPGH
jgi:large conductance mechanosensitive channel